MIPIIREASKAQDHTAILAIAKQSRYTKDFGSHMFSSDSAYDKGWIHKAINPLTDEIVGFTCVRHKSLSPETMLYFVGVKESARGQGVGKALMCSLEEQSLHPRIALKVEKDNDVAIKLYHKLGYSIEGEAYKGKGVLMAKGIQRGRQ